MLFRSAIPVHAVHRPKWLAALASASESADTGVATGIIILLIRSSTTLVLLAFSGVGKAISFLTPRAARRPKTKQAHLLEYGSVARCLTCRMLEKGVKFRYETENFGFEFGRFRAGFRRL